MYVCEAVTVVCGATCARQQARKLGEKGGYPAGADDEPNKTILSIITPIEPYMAKKSQGNIFIKLAKPDLGNELF